MTLRELRELVADAPPESDGIEVKVWLPGSRISLVRKAWLSQGGVLLIEGNVDAGSALEAS